MKLALLLLAGLAGAAPTPEPPRPAPQIEKLSPGFIRAGSGAFMLTVSGLYFEPDSVVRWNGSSRKTVVVDGTFAQASIPASDVEAAGFANVTVATPEAGGTRAVSAPEVFRITPAGVF